MSGLLEGVTVVEIGFMVAAPGAAKILGDLGADVIKVEPLTGDVGRRLLPFGDSSLLFETYNRGKKSVALDLRTESGRAVLRDLLGIADLLVTNLRPGFLATAGITWDEVHACNPRTTFACITSFGVDDPLSGAAGGDVVAQAESGLASFMGEPDGAPLISQNAPADVAGAMYGAIGMLAAYVEAQRTGVGRFIDLSLTDVYTTLDVGITPQVLASDGAFQPTRTGRFHPSFTPHGVFKATQGHVVLSAYGMGANSMWPRLATAIGRPELADAEGYRSDAERLLRRDELTDLIEEWLQTFERDADAVAALREHGVIAAPIRTPYEVVTSDRAKRRHLVESVDHPTIGTMKVIGLPLRISGFEPSIRPGPALGADTLGILSERLGYTLDQIDALQDSGAIAVGVAAAEETSS